MMKVYSRRQLMSFKLYDAEIEYLESTGTQWIDLGIYGNSYLEYEIKITFPTHDEWRYYFGAQTSDSSNRFSLMCGSRSRLYCNNGTATNQKNFTVSTGSPFVVKKINNNVYLNGTKMVSFTNTTYTTPRTIFLFACNAEDQTTPKTPMYGAKVYYFKIGNLDLIPVRIGTTGCLYDKVSGQLFGNSGTGSFILGPDKH